ncbi:MAG: serine/threonine protein kinase [Planctomycetes bacterium]|nr:serine/threonine protein kinase [Planctomycetota bacterium]
MPHVCPQCSTASAASEEFLGLCPRCLLGWAADAPNDPDRIGPYEILSRLGAGGMGVVYRARHPELQRDVALKLLAPGEDDERFLREARAAARLSHPSIVPVFETGRHEGRLFTVMELVDGRSLAERLKAGPLEPPEAASLVAQVARALQHAHQAGILHRDVKPSNILLDREGHARLADFGIARDLARQTRGTASGSVLGTPAYMAPEQVEGQSSSASDIYALGATLYECLTGSPPFEGATPAQLLQRALNEDPIPPRRRARVPRNLEAICLKALAKKPAGRYPSAGAMADDLERFLRGQPVTARPAPAILRAARIALRHRFAVGATLGLLAATLSLTLLRAPDDTEALRLLAEARALTAPVTAEKRKSLLLQAHAAAHSPALRGQIDDLLGRADAWPWLFLLVAGALPPGALDAVPPEARTRLEKACIAPPQEALLALEHNPDSWRAWLARAAAHFRDDDPVAAREAARRARLLAPELTAAAAFEAVILRDPRFVLEKIPDPLAAEDARDPLIALTRVLLRNALIARGVVRLDPSYDAATLEDVPSCFLPIRAWLRLIAEDLSGARDNLACATPVDGASKEWNAFVEEVRRGVENPSTPWVLMAQARARLARSADPEPKIKALLAALPPEGEDPVADLLYRRPAREMLQRRGDEPQ